MAKRKREKNSKARRTAEPVPSRNPWLWGSVVLSIAGIGVSGYLAYMQVAGGSLACTRWAQCDVVNNSTYATLLGVSVSFIGLAGYLALLALAIGALTTGGSTHCTILRIGFLMALGGFAFSAWLTYVEIYIIEALCAWCLASAAIITLLTISNGMSVRQFVPQEP
jgi:uncharacterized membrane protein